MTGKRYTAKDITVLEGLDPVRKRPGMCIGGVGSAGLAGSRRRAHRRRVVAVTSGHSFLLAPRPRRRALAQTGSLLSPEVLS